MPALGDFSFFFSFKFADFYFSYKAAAAFQLALHTELGTFTRELRKFGGSGLALTRMTRYFYCADNDSDGDTYQMAGICQRDSSVTTCVAG